MSGTSKSGRLLALLCVGIVCCFLLASRPRTANGDWSPLEAKPKSKEEDPREEGQREEGRMEEEHWDEGTLLRKLEKGERIPADDARLVRYLRENVLVPPVSGPYKLVNSARQQFSQLFEQFVVLRDYFGGSTGGFFVEAGAFDGEFLSNTLWLERERNWTGLLIEPGKQNFAALKGKQRKAWLAHSCLSPTPHPQRMSLVEASSDGVMTRDGEASSAAQRVVCFPLESFLRAISRRSVEFFSLDVEGMDLDVLAAFPWKDFQVKVVMVETNKGTRDGILKLMAEEKYRHTRRLSIDDVFEKLRD